MKFGNIEKEKDLYYTMKHNNVAGPSIIFNSYHEKDKTFIRYAEMTRKDLEPKPCKKVVGHDANALHLWAIRLDMSTGQFTRRPESDSFKKQWSCKIAIEWLEWQALQQQIKIGHGHNNTEKRNGTPRLRVDGFCSGTQTVLQFHCNIC